jgi:polyhydroxyalkanoate synthesis regulator phasin
MAGVFDKSINIGFGLISYSREKIEEVVDELVNKGEVSRKDAKDMVNDLLKRGEVQRDEFKKMIGDVIQEILEQKDVAHKADLLSVDDIKKVMREELIDVLTEKGFIAKKV